MPGAEANLLMLQLTKNLITLKSFFGIGLMKVLKSLTCVSKNSYKFLRNACAIYSAMRCNTGNP